MVFDRVIYVTLITLAEMECNFTTTKELSFILFMCFRVLNFGQTTMIFRGDENFKKFLYCKCKCL